MDSMLNELSEEGLIRRLRAADTEIERLRVVERDWDRLRGIDLARTQAVLHMREDLTRLAESRDRLKAERNEARAEVERLRERAEYEAAARQSETNRANEIRLQLEAAVAEVARLRAVEDCGQEGVCRITPGCNRHWEERNRELVEDLRMVQEALGAQINQQIDGRRFERERADAAQKQVVRLEAAIGALGDDEGETP